MNRSTKKTSYVPPTDLLSSLRDMHELLYSMDEDMAILETYYSEKHRRLARDKMILMEAKAKHFVKRMIALVPDELNLYKQNKLKQNENNL